MTIYKDEINEKQLAALLKAVTPVFGPGAGTRLAYMRMGALMDQKSLGKLLGVSQTIISAIEKGRAVARHPIEIERLAGIFGLRGTLYILCGMYAGQFEGKKYHSEYWKFKNSAKGDRTSWRERLYGKALEMRANATEAEIMRLRDAEAELERIKNKAQDERENGEKD